MCGAYVLVHNRKALEARFDADPVDGDSPPPRYKITPSSAVEIVRLGRDNDPILDTAEWGLVPFWAKDRSVGRKMINARAETLGEKPVFRNALAKRRCLIPADGFYEWDKATRQPMFFGLKSGDVFGFAGLWEEWKDPESSGEALRTCTIITTQANAIVARVHDRMPVIVRRDLEALWLGDEDPQASPGELRALLQPYPDDRMESHWVSKRLNARGDHGPESIEPAQIEAETSPTLSLPL